MKRYWQTGEPALFTEGQLDIALLNLRTVLVAPNQEKYSHLGQIRISVFTSGLMTINHHQRTGG